MAKTQISDKLDELSQKIWDLEYDIDECFSKARETFTISLEILEPIEDSDDEDAEGCALLYLNTIESGEYITIELPLKTGKQILKDPGLKCRKDSGGQYGDQYILSAKKINKK